MYVFKDGIINNFAEKGIKFEISEDGNPSNVKVKEFDGKYVDFETITGKSYTIKLVDTEKYTMEDVHITMEKYPGDGYYWGMLKQTEIPEGDDGKIKALWLTSKNPEDYVEVPDPDQKRTNPCDVFNTETVRTAPIDVEIKDGTDGSNLEFVLFDSTQQKVAGRYKLEDGKFPALDLIKLNDYIIQLVDDDYKMDNAYIRPYAKNMQPYFFKLDKKSSKLVISKKPVSSMDDGRYEVAFRVVKDGQTLVGEKVKFYAENDTVDATVGEDGFVRVRLFEDVTYVAKMENEQYTTDIKPIVIKDKSEAGFGKYTYDHSSCGGINSIVVYDKEKDSTVNKGSITCKPGNTTVYGMNFKDLYVDVAHPDKMNYPQLQDKDVMIYDIALVNPFRCERSKIAVGNFQIKRRIAPNKEVAHVYYLSLIHI